jgi:predicted nucleotide-binding protein
VAESPPLNVELDKVKQALGDAGLSIKIEKRLPNDTGAQVRLTNGAIVNCFDNGTVSVQGKNRKVVEEAIGVTDAGEDGPVLPSSKVFVVYGHDQTARDQLEAMLRRWGLDPVIFEQLPSEGATLIEKLENYVANAGFAVVLATPDDAGYPRNKEDQKAFRARQNVVLELGMLLAHLGRKRVAILLKDQESMERPSDIQGLIYIPFKSDLAKEAGLLLAKEMTAQGFRIDVAKI